ncbi:MAG: transcription elongation factor GreA [Acutalibacteraceae bacterium]|nr:transcription elongation factor GreA [Clostridiales bacterium]
MADEILLTYAGLHELEAELEQLKTVGRKEVAEKIKVALSFGDLSENSEYDEAKSDQGKLESRINEIEAMLQNVKILDEDNLNTEIVHIGSKLKVKDVEYDEIMDYQIVGFAQADPEKGRISDESPVGKALLGHTVGDTVEVEVPAGKLLFEIVEISK